MPPTSFSDASKILYSPEEVDRLQRQGAIHLVDIREREAYDSGHLPGAVSIPEVFTYLSTSPPAGLAALHDRFRTLFGAAGLTVDRPVVFYEESLESRYGASCRGYWLATYLGHPGAGILDGGLAAWQAAALPLATAPACPLSTDFPVRPNPALIATRDEVLAALDDPGIVLLDNRDRPEWRGETSSPYGVDFAPRRGRIPGATWIEWYAFMDCRLPVPAFLPADEIRALCAAHRIYPNSDIIIYCFKGARAAHTYVALTLAGFAKVRVYFASWNEWARDPSLPID